ncbi:MAG TPA: protein kinase [Bryobacteraceae bacterium]|nr:protein kinase [Bryobacteraceae bacterium]
MADWKKVEEVFLAAAELAGVSRARYLDQACEGFPGLQAEVESLLAAEEAGAGRGSLTGAVSDAAASLDDEDLTGRLLGPWQIDRAIGQGGMGSVYLGSRADQQFEKRVAIKILRRGMESGLLLTRFRHERQILAQLSHPGIAQLLDGGSTPDGRPYLVMEYVDGAPLDEYCITR